MKPLLVGEDNPYGADPRYALWCEPRHSAGGRLCYDVLGLKSATEYMRGYERVNLCSRKWSMKEARLRAGEIARDVEKWPTIVLLGQKVCQAFSLNFEPFVVHQGEAFGGVWTRPVVILPHPSGRNRMWTDPMAIMRARAAMQTAGALPVPPIGKMPPTAREYAKQTGDDYPPRTDSTTARPAYCDNCGKLVEVGECVECVSSEEKR